MQRTCRDHQAMLKNKTEHTLQLIPKQHTENKRGPVEDHNRK
jgi:septum formation inhibitor-activating ATPase MinD